MLADELIFLASLKIFILSFITSYSENYVLNRVGGPGNAEIFGYNRVGNVLEILQDSESFILPFIVRGGATDY